MSTLTALQGLDDGQFHRLCDALFRRLESRYRRLRPHGINERGESIVGQPDSYVGETAETCTIGLGYSVQKSSWWSKLVEDVEEIVTASPNVEEIVVATPRNVDREGPTKGPGINWSDDATKAAGNATLRVYDGREIANYLDSDHQDLRYDHLQIPYSRLSGESILRSSQENNRRAIEELKASSRYAPDNYIVRNADQILFKLWQYILYQGSTSSSEERPRFLPLVNDAGIGKTSLLCSFVESLGHTLPVVLISARDLPESNHSLVQQVIECLQGALEPGLARAEEVALLHHIPKDTPLTVVLDGLDEAKDASFVKRVLRHWFQTRLGRACLLIVSSRPEFWRQCASGENWTRWVADVESVLRKQGEPAPAQPRKVPDPSTGYNLPDLFTEEELLSAWTRAGRTVAELYGLESEVRKELRHPFTLKAYIELTADDESTFTFRSQAGILDAWLNKRLTLEVDPSEHLTVSVYQRALRVIAIKLRDAKTSSLSVDELTEAPRFDPAHPPGLAVRKMVSANILEIVQGESDHVRFSLELIQDHYLGEAEVLEVGQDPTGVADRISGEPYSSVKDRLIRIGQGLQDEESRNDFVRRLASNDVVKAATVLQGSPLNFEPTVRERVTEELGRTVSRRYRSQGALAIQLLGRIPCPQTVAVLTQCFQLYREGHEYLRIMVPEAMMRLGAVEGAEIAYQWPWFTPTSEGSFYFHEQIGILRSSSDAFKSELATEALKRIGEPTGSPKHGRAVTVLGYLVDNRLVSHLTERLEQNGVLAHYENYALIAVGTEEAAELYHQSAIVIAQKLREERENPTSEYEHIAIYDSISPSSTDVQQLISVEFEEIIRKMMHHEDEEISSIGRSLATSSQNSSLILEELISTAHDQLELLQSSDNIVGHIFPEHWLKCWKDHTDTSIRRKLLKVAGRIPNPKVEATLIDYFEKGEESLRWNAASALAKMGSYRAVPLLRSALAQALRDEDKGVCTSLIDALSRLSDSGAVSLFREAARSKNNDFVYYAIRGLGEIGGSDSQSALIELVDGAESAEEKCLIVGSLVMNGMQEAVSKAIAIANEQVEGPKWLSNQIKLALRFRGWRRGEFHHHIAPDELIPYLASGEGLYRGDDLKSDQRVKWDFMHNFRQIDGQPVRQLLRRIAERLGTEDDCIVRDDNVTLATLALRHLRDRGDDAAVSYYVSEALADDERRSWQARDLTQFTPCAVAKALRDELDAAQEPPRLARVVRLLGFFGEPSDTEVIQQYLQHESDELANAAYEAKCRLKDPLLLPEKWDSL